MAGEPGVLLEDTRLQKLANEAIRLHQQLLALLAPAGSETSNSFPPQPADQAAITTDLSKASREDDISKTNAANEASAEGGNVDPVQESSETPEAILAKVLRQGEELIGSFALTKGQESSREYKSAREELLNERKGVLKGVAVKLHGAEQAMEDVLDKHSFYKRPKLDEMEDQREDTQKHVTVEDIISYAHKISYSTFAPPSFAINQELPPGFQPPAPQAEHMRASALYQFSEEELGMKFVSTATPSISQAPEPSPASLPQPPPGWKPGMPVELPPMPPGWKPGMELPLPPLALPNLPPMPSGWKPGDPIPLPNVPPQMPPPGLAAPRQKAQPIQVAHVDLDLNPDLEGGFYSSDSDDDDDDDSDSEDE